MGSVLLEVEKLSTWIASGEQIVRAVDGLSFSVARGETFALLGESGCGKSMSALSIARLLPDAGRVVAGCVRLDGVDLLRLPEASMRDVRGRRIGMIFQEPGACLNPVLSVQAQIEEVLIRHTDLRGDVAAKRVLELLDAVGIPDARRRMHEFPFQLSGGMKQRVMIAMALACEPDLLIADEPTTALDVTIQAQVLGLLRELQSRMSMSILLITHDLGVVSEVAHRVAVMYAGEIVETASRERFFANPAHPYSRKLFESLPGRNNRGHGLAAIKGTVPKLTESFSGCRFVDRCDDAWDLCRRSVPAQYGLGGSQVVKCHLHAQGARPDARVPQLRERDEAAASFASTVSHASEPLLEVDGLKVHFPVHKGLLKRTVGRVKAVDGISLQIPRGRTLALVGESGCGKSTAGKGILRLIPATAGMLGFEGDDLAKLKPRALRARRKDVQIIFQDPYSSLDPRMRVGDIVQEGMNALDVGMPSQREAKVDQLLEQVGLSTDMKYRYPHEFSGGQRQRIAIARALAVSPKLIVCDEPTSALDVSVQAQILNLLKGLQDRLGIAYLFITHNISVVEYLAHEVAVMYLGRIVEHGTVDEVLGNPKHPYTRALLSAVPVVDPAGKREVIRLHGDLPSPLDPPAGCHFHPRCPDAMDRCREAYPDDVRLSQTHSTRCYLYGD
ncbi:MAG: ABC transporter ATP-binding protein [Burkholderiales bacterium]